MNVLVSGAGIAGLTLAYWLHQFGYHPTLIEKRPDLNDEGYMIDFYGSGFDVAEKMGLIEALRARHYPIPELAFVDRQGKTRAAFKVDKLRALLHYRHFNFMRGDLEAVLHQTIQDSVPIRFSTTITHIENGPAGVRVELSDGTSETYDLLIGADGIHSGVRKRIWGDENQFSVFLDYTVACGIIDNFLGQQDTFYGRVEPHKQATVYAIRGNRLATFFAFTSERLKLHDHEQQATALMQVFGDTGWMVPQLVQATGQSPQLYFDAVSQIKLAPWHKGRVALVGDACQCLTLLAGQGASMAMAGAYLLANELARADGQYAAAFQAYEAQLKPEIDRRQQEARGLAGSFVPENRLSIWLMYGFLRFAFLPGFRSLFLRQAGARSIIK